jgi:N-acetylneuraminic acid mutarotase
LSHKCGGNSMMGAPYPHPLLIIFFNHLLYVLSGSGNHSMWAYRCFFTLNYWAPISDQWFQLTFQIWSHNCGGNSMMKAPYPHSLHIIFFITLYMFGVDFESIDESLKHCMWWYHLAPSTDPWFQLGNSSNHQVNWHHGAKLDNQTMKVICKIARGTAIHVSG